MTPDRMAVGLQRRLLVLLLTPMAVLALLNAWFDYRSADVVALQQDQKLQRLLPLLADSVLARSTSAVPGLVLLLAPQIDDFLRGRTGPTAYALRDLYGQSLAGASWIDRVIPATNEPEFYSDEAEGVTYRIAVQKVRTPAGELVVFLADGSDPRQQWRHSLWWKVLLPNVVLMLGAVFMVNWAVRRALRPLIELKQAVERRSPRDLSPIDPASTPEEVQPLVASLNRLFGLVNDQAESQRRFIADAAHQLRTPLAGLQAQVEAWAQAVVVAASPPPTGARYVSNKPPDLLDVPDQTLTLTAAQIHRLRAATRRTSLLAHQLLALSRVDAHGADAQALQHTDLKDLCETVLESCLDDATAHGIDLGLDVQPAHVMGHDWLLRELLRNLTDNAIKYTPGGGHVTIRCGVHDGHPFLEVEDDGPGVPPEHRARVLERFYRVPGAAAEGNGLGLAIAAEIAHVHGSRLHLDSGAQGRGLRVRLSFGRPQGGASARPVQE